MKIHKTKIFAIVPLVLGATVLIAGCSTAKPAAKDVSYNGGDWNSLSGTFAQMNPECSGRGMGMPMMGYLPLPSRTFNATASGKTEWEASVKACHKVVKIAQAHHVAGSLDTPKTEKKSRGWTATCEAREFPASEAIRPGTQALEIHLKVCHDEKGICKEVNKAIVDTFSGVPAPIESSQNTSFVLETLAWAEPDGIETKQLVPSIVTTGLSEIFTPVVGKNGRILVAFTMNLSNLKGIKTLKDGVQFPVVKTLLSKKGSFDLASGKNKTVDLGNGFHMTLSTKVLKEKSGGIGTGMGGAH